MGGGRSAAVAAAAWQPQRGNFISRGGRLSRGRKHMGQTLLVTASPLRGRGDGQTNRRTDGHGRGAKPLLLQRTET